MRRRRRKGRKDADGLEFETSFRIQDTGDSDSEAEQERLAEYEAALKENAPDFVLDPDQELAVSQDSPEWYQLHLATERIRIPEILFQVGGDSVRCSLSGCNKFLLGRASTSRRISRNPPRGGYGCQ